MEFFMPSEQEIAALTASFKNALESQKQLFEYQVDQFSRILVTQCNLTGANPLAKEMAADALSINIQKNTRNLPNEKAVKHMQSLFSIKDVPSKLESRQISARYGITLTQVRQYFSSQRSRVRKAVLLSKERAIRSAASKETPDGVPASLDSMMPMDPVPLSSIAPSSAEEAASCLKLEEILKGLNEPEKMFVNTIFNSMREANTFSKEVALMEKIVEMKNSSVLGWFLNNGGLMILATWLSDATTEEQTSVLAVALKVLSHLPLHRALPAHISAIIQGVNRLRFYRTPGIADRARSLLARWSKILAKFHALRGHNEMASSSGTPKEIDLKQMAGTFVGDESWESAVDLPEDFLALSYRSPADTRNGKTQQSVKLLMASSDDSNKKHVLGFQNKERRKVLLVDQPGQKTVGKSPQTSKATPTSQGRPITADEIQKAKLRAQVMQSKHGKAGPSSNDSQNKKSGGQKRPSSLLTGDLLTASEAYLRPKLEAQKKARLVPPAPKDTKQLESLDDIKLDSELKVQIKWQTPPEIRINPDWRVGTGADSKEVQMQRSRTHRERETVYQTPQDIPSNPKEPWDVEMDYDDSLTVEIPTEQLPESAPSEPTPATSSQPGSSSAPQEPDLELLAVLLKNPDLVFALTSGQASGLSSEDTVKLLDMIKSSGGAGVLGAPARIVEERRVEVSLPSPTPVRNIEVSLPSPTPHLPSRAETSLPSPTPSSYPAPNGSRMEAVKNPFSRQTLLASGTTPVGTAALNPNRLQGTSSVQPQLPSQNVVIHQRSSISSLADQVHATVPLPSLTRSSAPPPQMNLTQLQIPPPQNPIAQNPAQVLPARNTSHSSLPMPPQSTTLEPHPRSQLQQSHSFLPEPIGYPQHMSGSTMDVSPVPESWQAREVLPSRPYSHINHQLNYDKMDGASVLHPSPPGPSWQRNEAQFESWSPDNSPRAGYRDQMQTRGWNHPQQRRNFGRGHGPPDWSRHQSSGGNRRWHEYDRRG